MVVLTSRRQSKTRRGIVISPQYVIYAVVGCCILCLTFLVEITYTESLDTLSVEAGGAGALRGGLNKLSDDKEKQKEEETKVIKKEWGKLIKRPDNWQSWGFFDVHGELGCGKHAHDMDKPLPDMDYWNFVRDKYKEVVSSETKFDDPILPTDGYTMTTNGEKQLYYAKKSPGKGRGLFASRDIKKGELVHDGNASDIVMTADEWRSMIFALPQKMACDLSEWTWTQRKKKDGPYKIFTAFNISILMNGSNKPNTMPKVGHSSRMYALRDIKKDEEILTDYKIYPTLWDEVGL